MADKLRENIRHEIDIALNEIHRDYDKHIDHATDKIMELVEWDRMEVYGKVHESADERIENLEAENKRMREELDAVYDMTPDHKRVLEKFNRMKEALEYIVNHKHMTDVKWINEFVDVAQKALGER